MLEVGKQSGQFFETVLDSYGNKTYRLKSMEQYSKEHNTQEQPSKRYFQATTLPEIIKTYPIVRKGSKQADIDKGTQLFLLVSYIDLLRVTWAKNCFGVCRDEQPNGLHRFC
jgi:dual specificity protein kinase YAK1